MDTRSKLAVRISRALISVYDKDGVLEFARGLRDLGVELLSTGGTAKLLNENRIAVREISDYTGFPEILGGRVKSLHPKIHAGVLYRRESEEDQRTVAELGISPIDMVVVNLYPFEKATQESQDVAYAVENIDVGGPTMIRAAAKNYRDVAVIVDPKDYTTILAELRQGNGLMSNSTRLRLMLKAFERTAVYDAVISAFFARLAAATGVRKEWPSSERLALGFEKIRDLRYGENPHQMAAVYRDLAAAQGSCIADARIAAGEKELSYTNILDADASCALIKDLSEDSATIIIKHTNPCGAGKGASLVESCRKALATDPVSAFGGVYGFTRPVDIETAQLLADKFVELVVAPGYDPEALKLLGEKKNRRILDITQVLKSSAAQREKGLRRIQGGALYQDTDQMLYDKEKMRVVTKRKPTPDEEEALMFGWRIVRRVKSNAIVLSSNKQLIGVGAGQMSRVDSCRIALMKAGDAGLSVKGSVMASDAFLPFRDSADLMGKAGVTAIIQPGGSMRDSEVIRAADEYGMTMEFTGTRHFVH